MKRRDWGPGREKVDAEGRCRNPKCARSDRKLDAAHLWHRSVGGGMEADLIVPLCGPSTDDKTCHHAFDAGKLDLLGAITADEEIAVIRAASVDGGPGLERARKRLYPSAYRKDQE